MNRQQLLPDSAHLPVIEDLAALVLAAKPLMDVRAPVEFHEGAFPRTTNLPLMNDAERAAIGKRYKEAGQDEAILLGLKLVSGEQKAERIAAWERFASEHPDGALYCFRGGLRSRISQQWLYAETGIAYPRVAGGYKALRRYLLDELASLPQRYQAYVLSGRTGSGKTKFLQTIQQAIDLEQLAKHRGSAFGAMLRPQPSQIDFENALATQLLQQLAKGHTQLVFEDESRNIGSIHLPDSVFFSLRAAPLILLETSQAERLELTYQEYIPDMLQGFQQQLADPQQAFSAFSRYLLTSLAKVQKRLGGVRYARALEQMHLALAQQEKTGEARLHQAWIEFLLTDYYDPMYDYQISQKRERVVFVGDAQAVQEFLASRLMV
ncbi:MAG: tRNA 2-selenouridine(34) synthase MnmH [Thiolinea sp.]